MKKKGYAESLKNLNIFLKTIMLFHVVCTSVQKNLPSNVAQQIIKSGLGQTKIITTTYILACKIIVTSHIAPNIV